MTYKIKSLEKLKIEVKKLKNKKKKNCSLSWGI